MLTADFIWNFRKRYSFQSQLPPFSTFIRPLFMKKKNGTFPIVVCGGVRWNLILCDALRQNCSLLQHNNYNSKSILDSIGLALKVMEPFPHTSTGCVDHQTPQLLHSNGPSNAPQHPGGNPLKLIFITKLCRCQSEEKSNRLVPGQEAQREFLCLGPRKNITRRGRQQLLFAWILREF